MNAVLSFLISAGIIAFGLRIITHAIEAGSPLGITLMGILPVAIGSISFYGTIREVRLAPNVSQSWPIKNAIKLRPVSCGITGAFTASMAFHGLNGLRQMFRPVIRGGLRVADGLGQHLAQLSLCLRWFPRDGCLPASHKRYSNHQPDGLPPDNPRVGYGA
jgi:hypothetical protein